MKEYILCVVGEGRAHDFATQDGLHRLPEAAEDRASARI
jgi:hypothetical protein